jgi:hypothetical protein
MKIRFKSIGAVVGEEVQITPNGKPVGRVTEVICEAEITDKDAQKRIIEGVSKEIFNKTTIEHPKFSGVSGYGVHVSGALFNEMPNGFGV